MNASWKVDATKILSRTEIGTVLAELTRKAKRSENTAANKVVFRLATCCGLRVSELCGLKLANVHVGIPRPYLAIPKAIAKGGIARRVPLWWDADTLADLTAWKARRQADGGKPGDFFVCAVSKAARGRRLDRRNARARFIAACGILGEDRQAELTIHHGRHSFCSHALAGGRTLAEVRDAAGHANVATTSVYTHIAVDDDGTPGDLFAFGRN